MTADGSARARLARPAVVGLGGGFMLSPEAKAAGKEIGLRGRELYVVGRGGAMGDVKAASVAAAFAFWEPGLVAGAWESGRAKVPVADAVARYAGICHEWGRNRWSDLAGAERLNELLGAVVEAADPAGLVLFAGWRAHPLPADPPARSAQLLHVLREHRGGTHVSAVRVAGLSPLEAVVAGPYGPDNAAFSGWSEPLPEVTDDLQARHARAEELTDEQVAPAYAVLSDHETAELADLLEAAAAAAH
jgi:hypothetical protein